jgi:hypothetical protein
MFDEGISRFSVHRQPIFKSEALGKLKATAFGRLAW